VEPCTGDADQLTFLVVDMSFFAANLLKIAEAAGSRC
jgi:K+ transporter